MTADLPYAGTSGYAQGSPTSEAADRAADRSGKTADQQAKVLALAEFATRRGITVRDVRETVVAHHGSASRALSTLHLAGRLVRLEEQRDRCAIYVLPAWAEGRATQEHGHRPKSAKNARHAAADTLATACMDLEFKALVLTRLRPHVTPYVSGSRAEFSWTLGTDSPQAVMLAIIEALTEES